MFHFLLFKIFPPKIFQSFYLSYFQISKICRNLLESCAKSQYSSSSESMSSPSSLTSRNTPDMNTSDSDTDGGTSLLHQALKRKRTDSETEQLFKRQFFLTTAPPNHFFSTSNVSQQNPGKAIFRPTTSVLTSSTPKFISRPIQSTTSSSIFSQSGSTPIFHIIQAPNSSRNLKLSTTHVELCQLLNSSALASPLGDLAKSPKQPSLQNISNISVSTQLSLPPSVLSHTQAGTAKETESKI